MDEIIQIKCPFDGAILSVKNQPGIETKNVTCPACKHKYPFTQYIRVGPTVNNEDPDTEYPNNEEHTSYAYDDRTEKGTELGGVEMLSEKEQEELNVLSEAAYNWEREDL